MDQQEARLTDCFLSVFPELGPDEIAHASPASVQSWDSVTTVTLLAVVEEEFGLSIEVDDLTKFDSFKGILKYLHEAVKQSSSNR